MGIGRTWTDEEKEYLSEKWGNRSVKAICKHLGRSENSIYNMAHKLKLGKFLDSNASGMITMNTLLKALGVTGGGGYRKISWIRNRGLPTHSIVRLNQRFLVVKIDEFWEWAEKNQSFLDFSKFERHLLGAEPDWVEPKRQRDIVKQSRWKTKNVKWTKDEDERLLKYLRDYKYTYEELSNIFNRTCGAILRRCCDLGYAERPVRQPAHSVWTDEQKKMLREMLQRGCNYQEMQKAIGKSEKAIRGKAYVLYRTENLDKIREMIKNHDDGRKINEK